MAEGWSRKEVDVAVDIYFDMLGLELDGRDYVKAEFIRAAAERIDRSPKSIEYKFQNISAALNESGAVFIDGYKPMRNYQRLLKEVVDERFAGANELRQHMLRSVSLEPPSEGQFYLADAPVDVPELQVPDSSRQTRAGRFVDYQRAEAENRKLGLAGEQAVVRLERRRLLRLNRPDLAHAVEHVSQTQGDGLGFDVLSFAPDGRERFIEVKTTRYSRLLPFLVTRNEVDFSAEQSPNFVLYRLFKFGQPRAGHYELNGALDSVAELRGEVFSAFPR